MTKPLTWLLIFSFTTIITLQIAPPTHAHSLPFGTVSLQAIQENGT